MFWNSETMRRLRTVSDCCNAALMYMFICNIGIGDMYVQIIAQEPMVYRYQANNKCPCCNYVTTL